MTASCSMPHHLSDYRQYFGPAVSPAVSVGVRGRPELVQAQVSSRPSSSAMIGQAPSDQLEMTV